jgi:hypothetical protein
VRTAAVIVAIVVVLGGGTVLASAALDRPAVTVREEMVIVAPRERVWRLLTEFEGYEDWNPFITWARGDARIGDTVRFRRKPQASDAEEIEAEVMDVKVRRKLRWRSRKYLPGILDEEHTFRVLPLGPDRVRLVYEGRFEGVLQPFADLEETKRGYERMAHALRDRAVRG